MTTAARFTLSPVCPVGSLPFPRRWKQPPPAPPPHLSDSLHLPPSLPPFLSSSFFLSQGSEGLVARVSRCSAARAGRYWAGGLDMRRLDMRLA